MEISTSLVVGMLVIAAALATWFTLENGNVMWRGTLGASVLGLSCGSSAANWRRNGLACFALISLIGTLLISSASFAEEPKTLMTRIAEWQYPDSTFHGATMSDAATLNKKGERTVPSIQCKTVLTTTDPIAKVVEYYKAKLSHVEAAIDANPSDDSATDGGQSITFHEDSENRPLKIHIIVVQSSNTSTTLVISRANAEDETHIAWTQYSKL